MRKKIKIHYAKERAVLSDVLPYETPLIFSNRYFYNYLIKRKKAIENKKYRNEKLKAFNEIESLLFSNGDINTPFLFKTKHKENDFRELGIIHPRNQQNVLEFYHTYKNLIIYYSSISPFSIRKPIKVADFTFFNNILHQKDDENCLEHSAIEGEDGEYENLKSFFSYRKYSNIHKFYESYQFHRSEKKFNHLLKIDVSKCFDSIYTHTISWALFNKQIIKDNIKQSSDSFPSHFDKLMQQLNANETNGIIIGPEFSRIFAELILQQIDKNIHDTLLQKKIIHKRDYEVFRYVDDYFIFYNTEVQKEKIVQEFKLALKEYKLYINDAKSSKYDKPIITEISLAKQKISDLFSEHLILKEIEDPENLYFSSNNVITRFKIIVRETNVDYKDIMNYSLAILDNKTKKIVEEWKSIKDNEEKDQKQFEKAFLEILDVAFFLYSVSPRVNSTIKICRILHKIINFLKKNKTNDYKEPFQKHYKNNIFKKISDEIFLILQKNKSEPTTPIESLYLLIALEQLGREYRLSLKKVCEYFNIQVNNGIPKIINDLDYFSITVLLFYIKNINAYRVLMEELKRYIFAKFEKKKIFDWKKDTEFVILLLDILTCPYLNGNIYDKEKREIISMATDFHKEFIKPITNINLYSQVLRHKIEAIGNSFSIKNKIAFQTEWKKLANDNDLYLKELNSYPNPFNRTYEYEENLSQSLKVFFYTNEKDIYEYKKKILCLLNIDKNQKNLINMEKYWFIKWTNFDFGLELEAKRSQEVY